MNIVVVYYSWSNGNTKSIAEALAKAYTAPLVRIDTREPYVGTYDEVVQQGLEETKRGYCPDIKPIEIDLDAFDTLAVGTPTWWYTMAPAVLSFLKKTNFEGKTVIPFMTNGGWPGHVIKDMTTRIENRRGTVKHPFEVRFDSTGGSKRETPQDAIDEWISQCSL